VYLNACLENHAWGMICIIPPASAESAVSLSSRLSMPTNNNNTASGYNNAFNSLGFGMVVRVISIHLYRPEAGQLLTQTPTRIGIIGIVWIRFNSTDPSFEKYFAVYLIFYRLF
jgi:hypothetical protein